MQKNSDNKPDVVDYLERADVPRPLKVIISDGYIPLLA